MKAALVAFGCVVIASAGVAQTDVPPVLSGSVQQSNAGGQTVTPANQIGVAVLYEENADTRRGADTYRGRVSWRGDTEGNDLIIRGLVEIPERQLKMLLTIRRNIERTLPATHTVELLFDTPANFPHGAVENVAGLRMKPSEQANGVPLVGAAARITDGYFLIGLTSVGADRERNIELLRERAWIDLPIVYRDGRRAVVAIERGDAGARVFAEAFATWGASIIDSAGASSARRSETAPARNSLAQLMAEALFGTQSGPSTGHFVQFTSQLSEAAARAVFADMARRYPALLGASQPDVRRVDLGDRGTFYRARVGAFESEADANAFCASLRAAGGTCVVATP